MYLRRIVCSLLFVSLANNALSSERQLRTISTSTDNNTDYRLPNDTVPLEYTVKLIPFASNLTFVGETEILVNVLQKTNRIILNSKWLVIRSVNVTTAYSSNSPFLNETLESTYLLSSERLLIRLMSDINRGNYTISIQFSGFIGENRKGIVRTFYHTETGIKRYDYMEIIS